MIGHLVGPGIALNGLGGELGAEEGTAEDAYLVEVFLNDFIKVRPLIVNLRTYSTVSLSVTDVDT